MDRLWSPWRYKYVSTASPEEPCLFCRVAGERDDRKNFVLLRAERNFVLLNRYPYTSGHVMIAPYTHVASLEASDLPALEEMIGLARRLEAAMRAVYRADGFNAGLNIGRSAGAGIEGHIHMHVLPRWSGDVNFMTTIGETRVLAEDLDTTYEKLSAVLRH